MTTLFSLVETCYCVYSKKSLLNAAFCNVKLVVNLDPRTVPPHKHFLLFSKKTKKQNVLYVKVLFLYMFNNAKITREERLKTNKVCDQTFDW